MGAAQTMAAGGTSVTLAHVGKSFGALRALNDVSLAIAAGTVSCIVGPPGAGRSTLLRCIAGLETIDEGEIRFSDASGEPIDAGFAPLIDARTGLSDDMTAMQQIVEGPLAGLKRSRRELVAQAMAALERVGLADRRDSYPGELSQGQRRRVAIARALAARPTLMLFDEPTAGLVPEQAGAMLGVMRDLAAGGMTMIAAIDDPDFVRAVASRVVFMDKGAIVEPVPGLAMTAGLP